MNKYQILLYQNLAIRGLFTICSNFKGMTMVFPPTDPHWLGKDKLKVGGGFGSGTCLSSLGGKLLAAFVQKKKKKNHI